MMQNEDEGDVGGPPRDDVGSHRPPAQLLSSSSSLSSSSYHQQPQQRYGASTRHEMASERPRRRTTSSSGTNGTSTTTTTTTTTSESPPSSRSNASSTPSPLSDCRMPSTITPPSPAPAAPSAPPPPPPVVERHRRQREDLHSLSDTDQPLHHHHHHHHQQHLLHGHHNQQQQIPRNVVDHHNLRRFIASNPPTAVANTATATAVAPTISPTVFNSLPIRHQLHSSAAASTMPPSHQHHNPPTTLQIRPASTATLSMSSSPTPSSVQHLHLRGHELNGGSGAGAGASAGAAQLSYHNQSFQLFPPDTRPAVRPPPATAPRLFHTRSCPQGSSATTSVYGGRTAMHRQVSVPVAQRELQQSRHAVQRSISRTQTIKNYIRKSTATFFGVDGESQEESRRRWMERRKRMASKNYGQLKEVYEGRSVKGISDVSDVYSTTTPGTAPSMDTPDSVPSRSWPRQISSHVSDIDSMPTTGSSSAVVRVRTTPSSAYHPLRRKDSVVRLTWDGIAYIASTVTRRKQRSSVGQPPSCPQVHLSSQNFRLSVDDSVFDDSTDAYSQQLELSLPLSPGIDSVTEDVFYDRITPSSPASTPYFPPEYSISPQSSVLQPQLYSLSSAPLSSDEGVLTGWRRSVPVPDVPEQDELSVGMKRMWKRITDQLFDNSDRRQYGMGVVGRYLKRSFRKDRITSEVKEQLEDMDDHRPFFTYWITTVQILITIISLAVYGFGPIGFEHTQRSGLVLVTSLSLQQIDYFEPDNFWIGPRAADLVHLGAKFAPCMRRDRNVLKAITTDRSQERNTACCIRNDNSGCVQTSRDECSTTISTWKKWHSKDTGPGGRISGSVCGQDPSYCSDPPSAPPYNWPDDITKWPICRKKVRSDLSRAAHEHMACEVIGHPCCVGILGECHITTRDYCDFVKGFFHEEAALCSQVSCLDDICGMIPFYNPEVPDQFYRLWTSLFLHAGLVHLSVTVLVQYFFMRDLEKLTGALRISLIYIVSGVAGNLASAIFVPYRAEVGPAGSQFGLLACLVVEVIHSWQMLKRPGKALGKLLVIAIALFVLGLLPWVDNYAHLFGFAFGFLLSYALLPFVSFGVYDRRKKVSLIWICLATVIGLFAALTMFFYVSPIYECEFCKYLTCLPLTPHFCTTQDINITTRRQL